MRAPQLRRLVAILSSAILLVAFTAGSATANSRSEMGMGADAHGPCQLLCYYYVCDPDHPAVTGLERAFEAQAGPGVLCECMEVPVCR